MASLVQLLLLAATIGLPGILAIPLTTAGAATCETIEKRPSWHDMTPENKKAFIAAEQCLLTSPAKQGKMPGAKTRWDELASLHQIHALQIHSTGQFLPYHRYLINVHKFILSECGYKGPIPYWDETRDAGKFAQSPVFDPVTGFGGDGRGTGNCVADGPFTNMTVNIGPGFKTQPRCVNRKITSALSTGCGKTAVDAAISGKTYVEALNAIYAGPHLTGHMALSLMNGDSITSCGDPVFFLHHGFVDKMWADWQAKAPANLNAMGGPNAQDPAIGFSEFPGGLEQESRMWGKPTPEMLVVTPDPSAGDGGNITTLNHIMTSLGIIPDATIKDIMDTKGSYLCYEYV